MAVYVPHQDHYPLGFLARIETVTVDESGQPTSHPSAVYYHFGRAAAHSSWLADFYSLADPVRPIRFALDSGGYASILPIDASGYILQPRAVAGRTQRLPDFWAELGDAERPIRSGGPHQRPVSTLRDYYDELDRQGYDPSGDFTARPFTRAYRGADGAAIVLFALQPTSRLRLNDPRTPASSSPLTISSVRAAWCRPGDTPRLRFTTCSSSSLSTHLARMGESTSSPAPTTGWRPELWPLP